MLASILRYHLFLTRMNVMIRDTYHILNYERVPDNHLRSTLDWVDISWIL